MWKNNFHRQYKYWLSISVPSNKLITLIYYTNFLIVESSFWLSLFFFRKTNHKTSEVLCNIFMFLSVKVLAIYLVVYEFFFKFEKTETHPEILMVHIIQI